jgi:predicted nicotinamide N-methyase
MTTMLQLRTFRRNRNRRCCCHCDKVGVRECGTRRQGCDESPGWVWNASVFLETYLLENLDRILVARSTDRGGCAAFRQEELNDDQESCAVIVGDDSDQDGIAGSSTRHQDGDHANGAVSSPPVPSGATGGCLCLRNQEFWASLKVLELGSGTGWLALRLAAHGASVTATDRVGTLPLLSQNVVKNQEAFSLLNDAAPDMAAVRGIELNVIVAPLEWKGLDENDDMNGDTSCLIRSNVNDVSASDLGGERGWDAIVASDVLYLKELYSDLLQTLRQQCLIRDSFRRSQESCGGTTSKGSPTVVVVAWEERLPAEEERFVELAKDVGFVLRDGTPRVVGANAATKNRMWVVTMSLGPPCSAGSGSEASRPAKAT